MLESASIVEVMGKINARCYALLFIVSVPSKKPLPKQPCKPLHSCGVFLYDGGIKKTLVFLIFYLLGIQDSVVADALRIFSLAHSVLHIPLLCLCLKNLPFLRQQPALTTQHVRTALWGLGY
jgi:hypothetical protein